MKAKSRAAVFLDRDGTIIEERNYLARPEDVRFFPKAILAIKQLNRLGFIVVVVTNQSGVARNFIRMEDVERIHQKIGKIVQQEGALIDAFYFCPHHPEAGNSDWSVVCDCRKPAPGMLINASHDLGIDLTQSWMVGDKASDIATGLAAGTHTALVLTGYGRDEQKVKPHAGFVATDLYEAVSFISKRVQKGGV